MMQGVITRMAENSRACKTWAVTLVAAILVAVARFGVAKGADPASDLGVVWIATVPVAVLGYLDAYYLAAERMFRSRYDCIVEQLHSRVLDEKKVFGIPKPDIGVVDILKAAKARTIWPVYLMMIAAIFAVYQWG